MRDATDSKPILDLLAEYKAEIVEDEIMDLPEDKEVGIKKALDIYLIYSCDTSTVRWAVLKEK